MELRNFMIFYIEKSPDTDRLIYYCRDLDSQHLEEFIIMEGGRKYPSDFFINVLADNGHLTFQRGKKYTYDCDYANSFVPLLFTALCDIGATNKQGGMKYEVNSHDVITIPNLHVREIAKLRNQLNAMMNR